MSEERGGYGGVIGAFPYAFRHSESRLFRLYWVVGTVLGAGLALFFALGLIALVAATADTAGGTLSLSRSFLILVGLLVVFPVLAPVLLVARNHRRNGSGATGAYDRRLGLAGFVFLGALYLGLVPTVPPEHRQVPEGAVPILSVDVGGVALEPAIPAVVVDGAIGPAVSWLYGLPPVVGGVIAVAGVGAILYAHRTSG